MCTSRISARLFYELIRVLADDGSLCWQVGNYVQESEIFPLDIFYYPYFKQLASSYATESSGTLSMGCTVRKDFLDDTKSCRGSRMPIPDTFNLDSVRAPSKYPGKTNFRPAELTANRQAIRSVRIRQTSGRS